jgi:hypothetical protein
MMVALEKALAAMGRDARLAVALPGNTHRCNALEQRCSTSGAGASDDETCQQDLALSGDTSTYQAPNGIMLPRGANEETGEIEEQYDGADEQQDDMTEPITMMIRALVLLRCFSSRSLKARSGRQ